MRKLTVIGGGGMRTPLLIHGLAHARSLGTGEVALFDTDAERMAAIVRLGREIVRRAGAAIDVRGSSNLSDAAHGADFVINSIRVGGIAARARDERIAIEHGFAGQETTGPVGAAKALRTIPVTLAHAREVERVAPNAWFINFTNPAGLMTQALTQGTGLRTVGICDTPIELFHQIAHALGAPLSELRIDYLGLNHLGWVRSVMQEGRERLQELLENPAPLYPAGLFDPALLQTLGLLPTEYVFFYYSQHRAHQNQLRAGASRGEEIERMNQELFRELASLGDTDALAAYTAYLQRRNASYMKLEAEAGSAFQVAAQQPDPFETATGYHRIAVEVMEALVSPQGRDIVVNVPNRSTIADLESDDAVEVLCRVSTDGVTPYPCGALPEAVRGLVHAVKVYERSLIAAAVEASHDRACLAMMQCPIVGQWEPARAVTDALIAADPEYLGYLGS